MKASLEHLSENINQPIQLKEIVQARFDAPYHFHPELELTLIISGEGKRFIGNQISDFSPGDLVLLGSNLPHCWQNHRNDWLGSDETSDAAQAIVIHFKRDFLGDKFLENDNLMLLSISVTPNIDNVATLKKYAESKGVINSIVYIFCCNLYIQRFYFVFI